VLVVEFDVSAMTASRLGTTITNCPPEPSASESGGIPGPRYVHQKYP
jgi:hypothetical protein